MFDNKLISINKIKVYTFLLFFKAKFPAYFEINKLFERVKYSNRKFFIMDFLNYLLNIVIFVKGK